MEEDDWRAKPQSVRVSPGLEFRISMDRANRTWLAIRFSELLKVDLVQVTHGQVAVVEGRNVSVAASRDIRHLYSKKQGTKRWGLQRCSKNEDL